MDCLNDIYLGLNSVLHDNPNTYGFGTPLKENVVSLLVDTSRLEFNTLCTIKIFMFKFLLITIWSRDSLRNIYQKHFLRGVGDRCVWLKTLPPSCATDLKSKCHVIWYACYRFDLIDLVWGVRGTSRTSGNISANGFGLRHVEVSMMGWKFVGAKEFLWV